MDRMCTCCGKRKAVHFVKGKRKKVKRSKHHHLCPKCYRDMRNRERRGEAVRWRRTRR